MSYVKFEKLNLKTHHEFNEHCVQDRIAEGPSILGLGDVVLKDKERIQPRAGRLDLLLQEADGNRRYEVEVQRGATDESHNIRTIEYWDIERKRYPQYEHTAVSWGLLNNPTKPVHCPRQRCRSDSAMFPSVTLPSKRTEPGSDAWLCSYTIQLLR